MKRNTLRSISYILVLLVFFVSNPGHSQTYTWQQTNGPFGGNIRGLAINSNGDIFAGAIGGGIFRSTDDGAHWNPINNGLTNKIVRALVTIGNGDIFTGTLGGAFRSTNNGANWNPINNGLSSSSVLAFVINSSGDIFAGGSGGIFRSTDNGDNWSPVNSELSSVIALNINSNGDIFAASFSGGVYRSTDNGDNWDPANNGLPSSLFNTFSINSSDDIFVGTFAGVYRSTDNGDNWSGTNTGLPAFTSVNGLVINGSGDIFAGTAGAGVYLSTDNGDNWSEINTGLTNTSINTFALNGNGNIFTGTGGGVFRSTDNGGNWFQTNNGLIATIVNALTGNSSSNIFAGTNNGVFYTIDNGDNWLSTDLTNTIVNALNINNNGDYFAGTSDGAFRSTDNGESWSEINTGLVDQFGFIPNVYSLTINSSGDILAGTSAGVFLSTNNGDNWVEINNGLTNTIVYALTINSTEHIFAGTGGGVFLSTDNGANWGEINTGLTNTFVKALAINSNDDIFAGTSGGVFRSTNNGDNWNETNTGLPNTSVNAFAISSIDEIFAGTFNGVFHSTDNGDNWSVINTGLTNTSILSLAIISSGGFVAKRKHHISPGSTGDISIKDDDELVAGSDGGGVAVQNISTKSEEADIEVTSVTVSNSVPEPEEEITFTIKVRNNGPIDVATNVKVTNKLPEGLTYVSHTSIITATYDQATGVWTIPQLLKEEGEITLQVTVKGAPTNLPKGTGAFIDNFVSNNGLKSPTNIVFGPDFNNDGKMDLYVGNFSTSEVLVYDSQTGDSLGTIVRGGSPGLAFIEGLAFGNDQTDDGVPDLYISTNDRVLLFDGATGASLGTFVDAGSGGLDDPGEPVFGPDRNNDGIYDLYICSRGTNQVLVYNGLSGEFLSPFVNAGSEGLNDPQNLVFGPDHNNDGKRDLYVTSRMDSQEKVLVYDGQTGSFLDTFVDIGSGGLKTIAGLAFGPDSNEDGKQELFVSSTMTSEVLRYDGKTGTFIDKFVQPFSGGALKYPTGIVFGSDGNLYISDLSSNEIKRYDGFPITAVNAISDQPDPDITNNSGSVMFNYRRKSSVSNTNDSGSGSLRDAMEQANDNNGMHKRFAFFNNTGVPEQIPVEISFNLPGDGPYTIALNSALPAISGSWITMDGRNQDGIPNIVLDGSNAGASVDGLTITGGNCNVRGLIIQNFDGNGIFLQGNGKNIIENSIIGTDLESTTNLGNAGAGVSVENSSMNIIGDVITGPGNIIAFNGNGGVEIISGTNNFINQNSIFSNNGPGIDLGGDGMTPNDNEDADTGPNNLQNFPEISNAQLIGKELEITYKVPSATTNSGYMILVEFFKADSDDEEGEIFIGSDTLRLANANIERTVRLTTEIMVEVGEHIIATATDSAGNTSEFSLAFEIITSVNDSYIPIVFALKQNYPNPFNPSTKINYSIPQTSFVKLRVYDILGKEIETLVNEEKQAGIYEIEFGRSNLSSGVYFYRLQTGSFTQTKKMILLR